MLVDSHCHLNFPEFKKDFASILKNAEEADIRIMQNICTKISEFNEILTTSNQYSNIYCSVGIHPHEVENEPIISAAEIIKYTKNDKVIGIGETGLDFYYENSKKELQIESFTNHINAARETGLPLIIHTRSAEEETLRILTEELKKGKFSAVIHCFTGTEEFAKEMLELGFYISISGIVTFKNAIDLQNTVAKLPLDRILIETDAPYLAPIPYRGKCNEPSYLKSTAEFIANLKMISLEELAKKTTENFLRLFNKVGRESIK
ncbi:MAG: TatD family hydrolase [Alphaproteobacteria bacterium]